MKLRIVHGKAKTDLASKCIEFIEDDLKKVDIEKIIVITEDNTKKEFEFILRRSNVIDPNLKIEVATLKDICRREISSRGNKRLTLLSDRQVFAIISKLIFDNRELLNNYKNIDSGLIKKFVYTIEILKKHNILPEDIRRLFKHNSSITARKLLDIETIYQKYEDFKLNKYLDKIDQLNYVSKLLEKDCVKHSLYLYKLSNLYPTELTFLTKLNTSKITVSVIADKICNDGNIPSGVFFEVNLFVLELIKHFNIEQSKIEKIFIENNRTSQELNHLLDNIYNYPYSVKEGKTSNLYITETNTINEEVEQLIKVLSNLYSDSQDTLIAVSDLQQYESVLKRAFKRNNIEYRIKNKINLKFHPLYKLIYLILEHKVSNTLESFIRLIRVGYFELSNYEISKFEQYIRKNNLLDTSLFKSIDKEELKLIGFNKYDYIKNLYDSINEVINLITRSNSIKDNLSYLIRFLESYSITDILKNNIKNELPQNISPTKLAWENLVTQLSEYHKVLSHFNINFELFALLIRDLLESPIQSNDKKSKGINIVELNDIGECDNLFILGANEGLLPRENKPNTLLTSKDILEFNKLGLLQGEDSIALNLKKQYEIYNMISRTNEKIIISYSNTGNDLATLKKSSVVTRIQQLFSDISSSDSLCNIKEHNGTQYNIVEFSRALSIISNLDKDDIVIDNILNKIEELKYISMLENDIEAIKDALHYKNKAICSESYALQNLYYSDTLSVSKLEKYAKCPFAYFVEYALKIKKEEDDTLQARHIGIIVHHVIENFDKRIKKRNISWDKITHTFISEEVESIINNLKDRAIMEPFYKKASGSYYIKKLKELSTTSIIALKSHIGDSFFEVVGHEVNFNDKGKFQPVMIKLPSGKRLKLQGQIDRLDKLVTNNKEYLRIVDYKTGSTTLDFTEIANGTQLQLLTYLDAILSSNNNFLPAGVFYFKLDDPFIKTSPNTSEDYIEESILKELRMKGLFIDNIGVIQAMDKGLFDGEYKTSKNIHAKLKTDGSLSKSTQGISISDLDTLRTFTKEHIIRLATDMLINCKIDISPMKKKSIEACTYCDYKGICQFDDSLTFNRFNILKEFTMNELIDLAKEECGRIHE